MHPRNIPSTTFPEHLVRIASGWAKLNIQLQLQLKTECGSEIVPQSGGGNENGQFRLCKLHTLPPLRLSGTTAQKDI
ncbi:BTB/POZ domain-containing protein KCTD15-like protein [Anopheles sinensis]|uniref:BTB/POZ domain-containing protein KCTD15-like protein n=1 Tax=Anopheles sinensis TaxID=74873 RepID=A0A084WU30_ANOSI|nr:BTB/POZ domain-containing protein KCTD15-like protein [Anopheles sinensis]